MGWAKNGPVTTERLAWLAWLALAWLAWLAFARPPAFGGRGGASRRLCCCCWQGQARLRGEPGQGEARQAKKAKASQASQAKASQASQAKPFRGYRPIFGPTHYLVPFCLYGPSVRPIRPFLGPIGPEIGPEIEIGPKIRPTTRPVRSRVLTTSAFGLLRVDAQGA